MHVMPGIEPCIGAALVVFARYIFPRPKKRCKQAKNPYIKRTWALSYINPVVSPHLKRRDFCDSCCPSTRSTFFARSSDVLTSCYLFQICHTHYSVRIHVFHFFIHSQHLYNHNDLKHSSPSDPSNNSAFLNMLRWLYDNSRTILLLKLLLQFLQHILPKIFFATKGVTSVVASSPRAGFWWRGGWEVCPVADGPASSMASGP